MEALLGLFFLFFIWVTYLVDKWRTERTKRKSVEDELREVIFENKQLNKMLLRYGKEKTKEGKETEGTASSDAG